MSWAIDYYASKLDCEIEVYVRPEFQRLLEQELNRLNSMVRRHVARRQELLNTKPRTLAIDQEMLDIGMKLTKLNSVRVTMRQAISAYKKNM